MYISGRITPQTDCLVIRPDIYVGRAVYYVKTRLRFVPWPSDRTVDSVTARQRTVPCLAETFTPQP